MNNKVSRGKEVIYFDSTSCLEHPDFLYMFLCEICFERIKVKAKMIKYDLCGSIVEVFIHQHMCNKE